MADSICWGNRVAQFSKFHEDVVVACDPGIIIGAKSQIRHMNGQALETMKLEIAVAR
jgi:hypothetical protein